MKNVKFILSLGIVCAFASNLFASEVSQWGGENRNGMYSEKGLLKSWGENGLKVLWQNSDLMKGYSGPAVVGGQLYLTGTSDDNKRESLFVLDKNGKTLWSLEYGTAWDKSFSEARTVPSIVGNDIFVISGAGDIVCIDGKARKIKWKVEALKEFGGRPMGWGYGENPLVEDGKIFFTVGGKETSMIALNTKDGSLAWKSESIGEGASYLSPIAVKFNGKTQIISGLKKWAFGVDAKTGKILWKTYLKRLDDKGKNGDFEINAATPVYKDGKVFITAGYNCGCYMLELPKNGSGEAKVVWCNGDYDTHHGGTVLVDGKLFGPTWINNEKGQWACYDWNTGKQIYLQTWEGHSKGSIAAADGMVYCYDEKRGTLALINPKAEKFEPVSTYEITFGEGRHWCHPVISDGVLYIRRGKVLTAFDVKAK